MQINSVEMYTDFLKRNTIYESTLLNLQNRLIGLSHEFDKQVARLQVIKENIELTETNVISLPTGSYEITQINDELSRPFSLQASEQETSQGDQGSVDPQGPPPISISANTATLNSVVEVTDSRYTIDMGKSTIRTVLGFSGKTLRKGRHESDQPVNIMPVSSILVKCSVIGGSYVGGSCIRSFQELVQVTK
jgi:hypothetical protein